MKTIYLAGPLGFSEIGRLGLEKLKEKLNVNFNLIEPFTENAVFGDEINSIMNSSKKNIKDIQSDLNDVNMKIGKQNAELIESADFLIAILDGTDVDSGTAAEIGYAYALNKTIYGYRGDFRYSSDNIGSCINLQVEYFIKATGGNIFSTIEELIHAIELKNKN